MKAPETRYALSGDVHIAYQVVGEGPIDLVFVPGWITHLELGWDDPLEAEWRRRLASFARLIAFDEAGVERLLGEYTFNHTRSLPGPSAW